MKKVKWIIVFLLSFIFTPIVWIGFIYKWFSMFFYTGVNRARDMGSKLLAK